MALGLKTTPYQGFACSAVRFNMLCRAMLGCVHTAALPDAASYREVCVALRQEHDKEVAISQQLMVRAGPEDKQS